MALTPGTRLGVFELAELLGRGGMGEVYRATDTKLKRQVAIKVLPPSFVADRDRLARFQREAEVLASLNHPNIAAIYGLEESEGITALVMELVEGDDLSQRIARGAIPIDEALPIAKQIAEALETAHEQGIIHRDLKPANIKVRSDGTVKVLDFGLAKAVDRSGESGEPGRPGGAAGVYRPDRPDHPGLPDLTSPTLTSPAQMTGVGVILGTAAYMAPEQAKGRPVDRRADIWAFGAVLYEMLTGTRAFPGEDVTDTIVAVMSKEPDFATLPATVPARVVQALRVCLRKDAKQRAHDMADVRLALEGSFETPVPQSTATGARPTSAATRALPWAIASVAVIVAGVLLTLWAPWRTETPVDRPLVRLDVDLGADVSLPAPETYGSSVVISPDGTRLVYASGTPPKLFVRRLDQPSAVELPGTQGATLPFFSPDGQWVGFFADRGVSKVSVEGGAVVTMGDTAGVRGASWDADGSIVAAVLGRGLLRLSTAGASQSVAEIGNGELSLSQPEILPGGKAILFAADNPGDVDKTTVQILTLADHRKKTVIRGGASPRYLATSNGAGHLIYVNKATLFAVPFDLTTLETRGTAVPMVADIAAERLIGVGQFDVSRTGTLVYRRATGASSGTTTVQWVDPAGTKEPLQADPGIYLYPRLAPDGKRIALTTIGRRGMDVSVYDPQRGAMTRLTFSEGSNRPVWSPDGRYVVFANSSGGLSQVRADGASQPQALTSTKALQIPWSFTPDGKRLTYSEVVTTRASQIWTVPLEDRDGHLTAGTPDLFLKSGFQDSVASLSPDGRWLAYQSNESGTNEVYVRAFPPPSSGQGRRWQISNSGGTAPHWSRGGPELVYQSGDQIMAAGYTVSDDTFIADKPRVWIANLRNAGWDLAPDGKRVAALTPTESAEAGTQEHGIVFVQNFFDELRRRVPLGK